MTATATVATDFTEEELSFLQTVGGFRISAFSDGGSFGGLLSALGCHSVWGEISKYNQIREQPPPSMEPQVLELLLLTLRATASENSPTRCISLIDGLSRNNRWRACLLDLDITYNLVFTMANSLSIMKALAFFHKKTIYKTVLAPAVCKMLNAWLKPAEKFKSPPDVGILARSLFGDAWCALNDIDSRQPYEAADLIRALRPRFRTGLVPSQTADDTAISLPSMEVL